MLKLRNRFGSSIMKLKLLSLLVVGLSLASCKCMKKEGCGSSSAHGKAYTDCMQRMKDSGVLTDDKGRVLVLDRAFFAFNQSDLTAESKKTLDSQAAWLQANADIQIVITGHCDERGTRE